MRCTGVGDDCVFGNAGFIGGSAQNALHSLVDMLASMRAPDGTITVEGFHE